MIERSFKHEYSGLHQDSHSRPMLARHWPRVQSLTRWCPVWLHTGVIFCCVPLQSPILLVPTQNRGKGGAVSKLMESMAAEEDFEPNQDSSFSEDENVSLSVLLERPPTPGKQRAHRLDCFAGLPLGNLAHPLTLLALSISNSPPFLHHRQRRAEGWPSGSHPNG